MKSFQIIILLHLLFVFTACSQEKPPIEENNDSNIKGLVGLSLQLHQNSPPGLSGYLESIDDVTSKGVNLFGMAPEWQELETAPNSFAFQDFLINPLTLTDPDKSRFRSYILVLKIIDSNRKTFPSDLSTNKFDDPLVIARFKNLIDGMSTLSEIERVSHLLIGNEVDGYLTSNPSEINAFAVFYQQIVSYIHMKIPTTKVGTIITFNSLSNNSKIFDMLSMHSDFICYTYYPTDNSNSKWQMRPPSEILSDFNFMAEKAGYKPFAFTEIGYPSSMENNSSEILQAQFVENMFEILRPYKDNGKLEFIFYHGLFDYPTGFCISYAESQGIDSTYLCDFMENLGLKDFVTGQPKQAWNVFVDKLTDW